MALIACPDCRKPVSESARSCPVCGCPVATRVAQMQREEEERQEALARQKYRQEQVRMGFLVAGIFLAVFVVGSIMNSCNHVSPTRNLYEMDGSTQNVSPGGMNAFQANGKLTITYSCQISAGKSANVQLVLEDTNTSRIVWQKTVNCSATGTPSLTDSVTVPDDTYDVGATIHGQAAWTVIISASTGSPTPTPSV